MTFTEFEEKVLATLYQEHVHYNNNDWIDFRSLSTKYGLVAKPGWLLETQKSLMGQGYIAGPSLSSNDEMAVGRIAASGMKYVEQKYGDKTGVGTIITPVGDEPFLDAQINFSADEPERHYGVIVDSGTWTGLEQRAELEPQFIASVSAKIADLERFIESGITDNLLSQKAKAITGALQSLMTSPEPDWKNLYNLLMSPALLCAATYVSLILSALGLMH